MPSSCPLSRIVLLSRALVMLLSLPLALVRCGSASPPLTGSDDRQGERSNDGGAAPDGGCGLAFEDARDAFAPERVCQTTEYDLVTGYCTHWVACSSL